MIRECVRTVVHTVVSAVSTCVLTAALRWHAGASNQVRAPPARNVPPDGAGTDTNCCPEQLIRDHSSSCSARLSARRHCVAVVWSSSACAGSSIYLRLSFTATEATKLYSNTATPLQQHNKTAAANNARQLQTTTAHLVPHSHALFFSLLSCHGRHRHPP